MAKVINIRAPREAAENEELHGGTAALNTALEQIAEAHPRLVALGWVIEGHTGSFCAIKGSDVKLVLQANHREQMAALATIIESLPDEVLEVIESYRVEVRSVMKMEALKSAQNAPGNEQ